MRVRFLWVVWGCVVIGLGVKPATADAPPATAPAYQQSNEELTKMFKDLLDASANHDAQKVQGITDSLVLSDPQPWFKNVFGDEKGTKLATQYQKEVKGLPDSLARLFLSLRDPRNLSVDVTRVESVDDPNAKGYQLIALAAMENPVALYSVTISKPGTSAKIEIWSLAYANGGFRWLGKMQAAKD